MVEMLDFKVGIAAVDLLAKADASAQVEIGERREARLERREAFGGGLRARKFLMVERDAAVWIEDGDGPSGKAAVLDRHVGALLADPRQRLESLAADPLHPRAVITDERRVGKASVGTG